MTTDGLERACASQEGTTTARAKMAGCLRVQPPPASLLPDDECFLRSDSSDASMALATLRSSGAAIPCRCGWIC